MGTLFKVFFIADDLIQRPGYILCFSLAPDGAIRHAAIVATFRQAWIGVNKQFGFRYFTVYQPIY
jgi:hypothetical protein